MKKINRDPLIAVKITEAKYLKEYIIKFKFSDGTCQEVDFKYWIETNAGGCKKYLNKNLFKKFYIISGKDIAWGQDEEMSFPFIFLYREHNEPVLV